MPVSIILMALPTHYLSYSTDYPIFSYILRLPLTAPIVNRTVFGSFNAGSVRSPPFPTRTVPNPIPAHFPRCQSRLCDSIGDSPQATPFSSGIAVQVRIAISDP